LDISSKIKRVKIPLKYTGNKWILLMLLLAALIIAVIIYYNGRIKIINDELNRISWVSWVVGSSRSSRQQQFAV